jgi:hypothetical protein
MTVSAELRPWRTDTANGMVIEWDLGIRPNNLAVPAGHRTALTVPGKDFERPGSSLRLSAPST